MSSPLVAAAADYLKRGLLVIALSGKTPNVAIHHRGLHDPLAGAPESDEDWALLRQVFEHPDTTGVGIVITYPYVVVDIDGEEGAVQWAALLHGQALDKDEDLRWIAQTGRGLHLWFASFAPTGSFKLAPQLDLKGQSSYVAAPPSQHPDGHLYKWLVPPGAEAPMEAPEPLARRIVDHEFDLHRRTVAAVQRRPVRGPRYAEGDTVFYAQLGFDALISAMSGAESGNRNNLLHWAAATMNEEGGIDEDFETLRAAALDVGLEPEEVARTIRSARRGR